MVFRRLSFRPSNKEYTNGLRNPAPISRTPGTSPHPTHALSRSRAICSSCRAAISRSSTAPAARVIYSHPSSNTHAELIGIEINGKWAEQAAARLPQAQIITAAVEHVTIAPNSISLALLNPPYLVTNGGRMELQVFRQICDAVMPHGAIACIIPARSASGSAFSLRLGHGAAINVRLEISVQRRWTRLASSATARSWLSAINAPSSSPGRRTRRCADAAVALHARRR